VSAIPITTAAAGGQPVRARRYAVAARRALARATTPVTGLAVKLAEIPLTVAGIGCIDAAAFVGNTIAGLVVTGLSLMALEYVIADEE
jgi:hypothetical protein